MTATILGLIGAGVIAVLVLLGKYLIEKAAKEKMFRELFEQEAKDLKAGLGNVYKADADNEKKFIEILSPDLTDERAGELLSSPIETGRVSRPAAASNGKRPGPKVPPAV